MLFVQLRKSPAGKTMFKDLGNADFFFLNAEERANSTLFFSKVSVLHISLFTEVPMKSFTLAIPQILKKNQKLFGTKRVGHKVICIT